MELGLVADDQPLFESELSVGRGEILEVPVEMTIPPVEKLKVHVERGKVSVESLKVPV